MHHACWRSAIINMFLKLPLIGGTGNMQSSREASSTYESPRAEIVGVASTVCMSGMEIGVIGGMGTQKDPTTGTGTNPHSAGSEANGHLYGGGIAGSEFD